MLSSAVFHEVSGVMNRKGRTNQNCYTMRTFSKLLLLSETREREKHPEFLAVGPSASSSYWTCDWLLFVRYSEAAVTR
jgi:hypothetical protein